MQKRILALFLTGVLLLSTGCGLSSGTKDKLFGDSDVSKLVANAVTFSNYELLDEYFKSDKISQDLMDDMLGTAMYTNDSYRMTNYLFENGADPNSDMQLVWDAAYNGWYIRTMPFIHHPDFDINKKNNQGHTCNVNREQTLIKVNLTDADEENADFTHFFAKFPLSRVFTDFDMFNKISENLRSDL